ncbi:MAG: hypothetical protein IJ817_02480 [Clostridia bacterium]|nr:hypothetical protein [Clostridia bacterium]
MIRSNLQASENLSEEERKKVVRELKLGYLNLSEELFDQAEMNFMLALQYDSKCADAYWGLMLEKCHVRDEQDLFSNPVTYKEVMFLNEYERAFEFATEDQKKYYNEILERIYAINEGEKY